MTVCAAPGPLSAAGRAVLPARAFALPAQRKYPLYKRVAGGLAPSATHARAAMSRAMQFADRLTARQFETIMRRANAVLKKCGEGSTMATKKKAAKKKAAKKKAPKKKAPKKKAAKKKAPKKKAPKKKAPKKKAAKRGNPHGGAFAPRNGPTLNEELASRKLKAKPAQEMAGRKDIYYGRDRVAMNMRAADVWEWLSYPAVRARFPVRYTVAQEMMRVNDDALPRLVAGADRVLAAAARKEIKRRAEGGTQLRGAGPPKAPPAKKNGNGNGNGETAGARKKSMTAYARERAALRALGIR